MDKEILYADNIQYDEHLPTASEETASTTLKERIGNRIYLLEDSRKRKSVDTQVTALDEDEDSGDITADLTHRSNALLLSGPPISQLPTARVFAYATHFDAHPIGLEWVDDQTCVLVFTSRKHALQAWNALRRPSFVEGSTTEMQFEGVGLETVSSAAPIPLALYPIEERINSVLGAQTSAVLKETINIRWARVSDVKQPGARGRSDFYKKHGEMAGKESLSGISQHKRRRYNEDDPETRRRLDADLDAFLNGEDGKALATPSDGVEENSRQPKNEETRRQLDEELDSFLAQDEAGTQNPQSSATQSLMDRTTRPLPRRRRRRGGQDVHASRMEGEDGRWLHNAEMRHRKRVEEFDENRVGTKAWREDEDRRPAASGRRSRRPHKTQEELDRELEEFLGQ